MAFQINNNVTWVGKVDWELRTFHGQEYSTHRGSSYNSYLVRDEKTALIDTVWGKFSQEFLVELQQQIPLDKIDFVIANHAETDHSGALPELMRHIPDVPIYCTANGVNSLKGHYHQDWNFQVVKTGDKLTLGSKELVFVEARLLHWPDNMMCYLTGDNILFSNDAFGQHLASEKMYNDLVDQAELFQEAIKYYANILTPFSSLVDKKIKEILELGLPVDMICPSHGVIWRKDPLQIVHQYLKWANAYAENQVTIIYDTMWDGTRRMAEAIAKGIAEANGDIDVKLYNVGKSDKNDVITEVFKSKAILVGSPTINQGILSATAAVLEEIRGLQFKNKKAAAFGCFGWSGESVKIISDRLREGGFHLVSDGIREKWNPNNEAVENCIRFGREFASSLT
ncbi:Flavorubredoxin [Desulfonatronum thiosulfatophilum]|uniref:Flavorubredoxin n=1 Tax=Desulfonatronum thiosulfatophilum TaxID=617002 RepID=A0A1G6AWJ4_9BACT|nr:anaerobic nitric oxide reductase flavorubredoxin [Desulfonatronum thiosulfatophilum]SDB12669.1 Flavorubredoxin [Desulfonatronum thiosulfatophilum]